MLPHKLGPPWPRDFLRPKDLGCGSGGDSPPGDSAQRRSQVGLSLDGWPLWTPLPTAAGTHGERGGRVQARPCPTVLANPRPESPGGSPGCGKGSGELGLVPPDQRKRLSLSVPRGQAFLGQEKSLPPMPGVAAPCGVWVHAEGPGHVVLRQSSPPKAPNHGEGRNSHLHLQGAGRS